MNSRPTASFSQAITDKAQHPDGSRDWRVERACLRLFHLPDQMANSTNYDKVPTRRMWKLENKFFTEITLIRS